MYISPHSFRARISYHCMFPAISSILYLILPGESKFLRSIFLFQYSHMIKVFNIFIFNYYYTVACNRNTFYVRQYDDFYSKCSQKRKPFEETKNGCIIRKDWIIKKDLLNKPNKFKRCFRWCRNIQIARFFLLQYSQWQKLLGRTKDDKSGYCVTNPTFCESSLNLMTHKMEVLNGMIFHNWLLFFKFLADFDNSHTVLFRIVL
jgi:hypothetical protein